MDIKGIVRNVVPFGPKATKTEASADTHAHAKSNASNDREGNGQAAGDESQKKRKLTASEIEEAVKHLESLAGVKENNLIVRAETKDDVTVVYVEDRDGKVVRRIPEGDLASLAANREKKNGHLLNKAM